jgi:radical SAM superfamily enzyme YgiQ (UPF0313 family)
MLTSRGCPARCTFCANYVTGRRFRHRSTASALEEMEAMHRLYGEDGLVHDVARRDGLEAEGRR